MSDVGFHSVNLQHAENKRNARQLHSPNSRLASPNVYGTNLRRAFKMKLNPEDYPREEKPENRHKTVA